MQVEEFLTRAGLLWLNGAVIGGVFLAQALPFIMAVSGAALFLVDPDHWQRARSKPKSRYQRDPRVRPSRAQRPDDFTIS